MTPTAITIRNFDIYADASVGGSHTWPTSDFPRNYPGAMSSASHCQDTFNERLHSAERWRCVFVPKSLAFIRRNNNFDGNKLEAVYSAIGGEGEVGLHTLVDR